MRRVLAIGILTAGLCGAALPAEARDPFDGPNLLLTRERLEALQEAKGRGDPLVEAAWADALRSADGYLTHRADPIQGKLAVPGFYTSRREEHRAITRRLRADGYAARALALGFALTGRDDYAQAAEDIIFAWVDGVTGPADGGRKLHRIAHLHKGDTPIVSYYSLPLYLYAYDLLNGLGRIDDAERARFEPWLRGFVHYLRREEVFKNNHHAWQCVFLLSAGHVLRDPDVVALGARYLRNGLRYYVARDGSMWRELVRGERAATYTLMALEGALQAVVLAERHGHLDLRDQRARRRTLSSGLALRAASRRPFASLPVPREGGTLHDAVALLADFVDDPTSWERFRPVTRSAALNGPARPEDWGWLFELSHALWEAPRDRALAGDGPHGTHAPRAYTLNFATLLFRPLDPPPASPDDASADGAPADGLVRGLVDPAATGR